VEQGVRPELDDALKKRVRLTNALCLFAALVLYASVPFDWLASSPRWMLVEDVVAGSAFLSVPLLSRRGHLLATRVLALLAGNVLVFKNGVFLGRDSGASLVFIALAAVPFALFDLRERRPLVASVFAPVIAFALVEAGVFERFASPPPGYSPTAFRIYSGAVTLSILLFCLAQIALANARAERELRDSRETSVHTAKLAALGEMSGNIAHEVNNPLAAMLLRTQMLIKRAEDGTLSPDVLIKNARDIEKTGQRIAKIVESLRTFARDAAADPMRPEPVAHIVRDTIELCSERFRQHGIALETDPIDEGLKALCRSVQVSQILLNLLSNAHDAVEHRPERWVRISAEARADEVRIVVTDSGEGIPPDVRERMMEPFFTTKEVGKGTGLGLSVSKGLAEAHGGRLECDALSQRTRFVLTLPRACA
jgi:C4-dicarboxylate-specific signal transduction histidine kinase